MVWHHRAGWHEGMAVLLNKVVDKLLADLASCGHVWFHRFPITRRPLTGPGLAAPRGLDDTGPGRVDRPMAVRAFGHRCVRCDSCAAQAREYSESVPPPPWTAVDWAFRVAGKGGPATSVLQTSRAYTQWVRMASVCIYFQVHQPYRLRRYSVFDTEPTYFDHERDAHVIGDIARDCYLPASRLLLDLIKRHKGQFRFAFSLTGTAVEQLQRYCPEVVSLLKQMAATGCVEFLGETYHHSLTFLYSRDEFDAQIHQHARLMKELFGQTPGVFRNTELIYSNELAAGIGRGGPYHGILAEGADHVLGQRSPNHIYRAPGVPPVKLLLKNHELSDDIELRFSNERWTEYPLTADKFARWIDAINGDGCVCNLFMEYEVLGVLQRAETDIFDFLDALPDRVLQIGANDFKTPSQCLEAYESLEEYDVPHTISWADPERDLSAWVGNAMQSNALHELYKLEAPIKRSRDLQLLTDWRRLTASDHFYYMSTKYFSHGDAHKSFNPYESPYDGYINFMNVLDNLHTRLDSAAVV